MNKVELRYLLPEGTVIDPKPRLQYRYLTGTSRDVCRYWTEWYDVPVVADSVEYSKPKHVEE